MNETTNSNSSETRLAMTLKVGAVVAVLSLMALTVEHPRLAADIANDPIATGQASDPVDADADGKTASTDGNTLDPTASSTSDSDYFPGKFPAPQADTQPLPPTF